jgi:hypothetical protein
VVLEQLVLDLDDVLAFALGRLAEPDVLGAFDALGALLAERLDPCADALGDAQPREASELRPSR